MEKVVVTHRSNDYHACLAGRPGIRGCGKTPQEAIGDLIITHEETMGIEVELPTGERHPEFDLPLRNPVS